VNLATNITGQRTLNVITLFAEDSVNCWWERTEAAINGLGGCYEIKWVSLYCPVLWCPLQGGMLMSSACLFLCCIFHVVIKYAGSLCVCSNWSLITFESFHGKLTGLEWGFWSKFLIHSKHISWECSEVGHNNFSYTVLRSHFLFDAVDTVSLNKFNKWWWLECGLVCQVSTLLPRFMMIWSSVGWDHVSELRPPTGLLFVPQMVYEHGEPWWNAINGGETPDSSTRALWHSHQQSHVVAKQEGLAKEVMKCCIMKYLFHTWKGSLTCRKMLRHGADGFTSPPKEGMLQIFIILGWVKSLESWVQWQAC
jgi:hypothetical protein